MITADTETSNTCLFNQSRLRIGSVSLYDALFLTSIVFTPSLLYSYNFASLLWNLRKSIIFATAFAKHTKRNDLTACNLYKKC